jgi:excisionase family DNA binding protein
MSDVSSDLDAARDRLREQARDSEYLTVPEAAQLARCNPMTIRRAFTAGVLPAFRPAHRVLLRESDVREWIESRPAVAPDRPRPARKSRRRPAPNGKPVPGSAAHLREIDPNLTR